MSLKRACGRELTEAHLPTYYYIRMKIKEITYLLFLPSLKLRGQKTKPLS